jgi:hypothetical protein
MTFKAHVRNGRITLDEPTNLPDGTEVALEEIAELDDGERERLEAAIAESDEDIRAGRVRDAFEVIDELRRR